MWRRLIYHPEVNYALRQTLVLCLPVAIGLLLGHLQPHAALLARLRHGRYAHAALLGQRVQQGGIYGLAHHQHGRRRYVQVVLGHKGLQHLGFYRFFSCLAPVHRALAAIIFF